MHPSMSRLVYIYLCVCLSIYLIIYLSNGYLSSIYSKADPELVQEEATKGLVLVEEWTFGLTASLSWAGLMIPKHWSPWKDNLYIVAYRTFPVDGIKLELKECSYLS